MKNSFWHLIYITCGSALMSGVANVDLSITLHRKLILQQNSTGWRTSTTTWKLAGKRYPPSKPIKDALGNKLTRRQDRIIRWVEYFNNLLNRLPPLDVADIPDAPAFGLNTKKVKATIGEIKSAIRKQKNNRAPGPDRSSAEILKDDLDTSAQMLYEVCVNIWEDETSPRDWKEGHLVRIPKKGDLADCSSYRGKTMLSVPGKILNRIILLRLTAALEAVIKN